MYGLPWWLGGRVRLPVETWVWSLGWEDPLEEEMASFSSILAWKIPQTEEPGGLQSIGHKELDTTEWLIWSDLIWCLCVLGWGALPEWLSGKNLPADAGHMGSIPGLGRSPLEENGKPIWYSCLGNPMDRGAWWATVHRIAKESDTT